jgi:hypothetical protein
MEMKVKSSQNITVTILTYLRFENRVSLGLKFFLYQIDDESSDWQVE